MNVVKNCLNYLKGKQLLQLVLVFISPVLFYLFPKSSSVFLLFLVSLFLLYKVRLKPHLKGAVALLDLLVIIPLAGLENSYYLGIITQIVIYAVLAMGLNVVIGFAGLLDLGYVGFYAVGAYLYAFFATSQANNVIPATLFQFPVSGNWFWVFLPIALVVSAGVGVLLGLPVLRLKGDYLAIVTLGFAEIIRIILNNADKPVNLTNGPKGLTPVQPPELFGIVINQPIHYYFIVLLLFVIIYVAAHRLDHSRIGRAWAAIREDELAARTMGIPLVRMKLLAFATGAGFAGMMGVVFAARQTFIDPSSFGFMESIGILAMVIMGGMGNIRGVILGAAAVVTLQLHLLKELSTFLTQLSVSGLLHIPSQLDPAKYEKLIFGLILILMCIFRPKGLMPPQRTMEIIRGFRKKRSDQDDKTGMITE
ncbi:branched-chain amino acid ABC transporter permease [Desulfitobacterium chlororespirans]|uniref:Amino acid/amide ABC transporter membrane protein 2, HAAT family (TC 3.A.1.4.-) n=1 Tax=Desulfitobacterium chlororespirans DSM 11544 TaxID=1121395 RepID=A0A1M7SH35_9FIRM|nr:branched-chain amino acid ABC transporter permease [Desulfitobacterium chlororespirans]SHN57799.1 amino acid/amide ABC transporter membrane protein 2, HAAT family (TC 3.A.1.4.-) [Desulfitobacterium chlororespirans DSM 11544]